MMQTLRAFTVRPHWGLLIRAGLKTCENRSFRAPPGFYLVHASASLGFYEWGLASRWVAEHFGFGKVDFPSYDECLSWRGQVMCGVWVVSACTVSSDPWHIDGKVAWELESPVKCARGVHTRGFLGCWPVGDELCAAYREAVRALQCARKGSA